MDYLDYDEDDYAGWEDCVGCYLYWDGYCHCEEEDGECPRCH